MIERVSKEQAIKLKELKFNEKVNHFYILKGDEHISYSPNYFMFNECEQLASAPTLAHVQTWLRKEHHIIISVDYAKNGFYKCMMYWKDSFGHDCYTQLEEKPYVWSSYDDYDKALSFGITKALKLIG